MVNALLSNAAESMGIADLETAMRCWILSGCAVLVLAAAAPQTVLAQASRASVQSTAGDMPRTGRETRESRRQARAEADAQAEALRPASRAERQAISRQDLVTQTNFWAQEFQKNAADLEAGRRLSELLRQIGSHERAAEVANQALAAHPEDAELWTNLALSLTGAGAGVQATGPLERALALNPRDPRLPTALGVVYDQMELGDQARAAYRRALTLSPNDPAILTNLGVSYALSGDLKSAEVELRRAAALPSSGPQTRQNLALVLGLQGRFEEAQRLALADLPPQVAEENTTYLRAMLAQPRRWEQGQALRGTSR